jgi:hypothetical protein
MSLSLARLASSETVLAEYISVYSLKKIPSQSDPGEVLLRAYLLALTAACLGKGHDVFTFVIDSLHISDAGHNIPILVLDPVNGPGARKNVIDIVRRDKNLHGITPILVNQGN